MLNDIISDHKERMLNLKKYYPFFKLTEVSFSQFKDGKYEMLDMGYILMGILRFFIEENNFKEKDVIYPEILEFVSGMLRRDFSLNLTQEEAKEITDFVFDKIKNEGRPFEFEYFDPVERKKRIYRMKIIESTIRNNTVWYSISSDAIEFYLDTKEIKDESKINVQQLLLEKMIKANNFEGGTEVVARINEEVNRLQLKKNEVMNALSTDVFAGIEAYDNFVDTGMRWFEDEERLFKKNSELIEAAIKRMSVENQSTQKYYQSINQIYELENQLKVAMNKHGDLLKACMDMRKLTDEAIKNTKLSRLRAHVDFKGFLADMIKTDNADILIEVLSPLLKPNIRKRFNVNMIDEALTLKPYKYDKSEEVVREEEKDVVFADEAEDERIKYNYIFIMKNMCQAFESKSEYTLQEFNDAMSRAYSEEILKNCDYYSFFVNLFKKKEYILGGNDMENESFLDEIISDEFNDKKKLVFTITMDSNKILNLGESAEISNAIFTKMSI